MGVHRVFSTIAFETSSRTQERTVALEIGKLLRGEAQLALGGGGGRRRGRVKSGRRHPFVFAVLLLVVEKKMRSINRSSSTTTFSQILAGLSKEWGKAAGVLHLPVFFLFCFCKFSERSQQWTRTTTTRLVSAREREARGLQRELELVNECQRRRRLRSFPRNKTRSFSPISNSPTFRSFTGGDGDFATADIGGASVSKSEVRRKKKDRRPFGDDDDVDDDD